VGAQGSQSMAYQRGAELRTRNECKVKEGLGNHSKGWSCPAMGIDWHTPDQLLGPNKLRSDFRSQT